MPLSALVVIRNVAWRSHEVRRSLIRNLSRLEDAEEDGAGDPFPLYRGSLVGRQDQSAGSFTQVEGVVIEERKTKRSIRVADFIDVALE
jgi:hypothetical protein